MARYRKIDIRIWNDRKFRGLDDKAKLAFFLVLTHPDTNQLGMLRSRSMALAMELGWHPDVMSDAITKLCQMGMLMVDDMAGFIFIPNFLKYNPPNGPNAVKGWAGLLDQMPECNLLDHAVSSLKPFVDGLSEGLRNAIPNDIKDAITHAIPNDIKDAPRIQEQEQEQEQDNKNTNKQQTEICNEEPAREDSVCSVSSCEDIFSEDEVIDAPVKVQIEHAQLGALENINDEKRPLTLVELITACKTFGIKLGHTPKTEAIANRKTVNLFVLRECVKAWKGTIFEQYLTPFTLFGDKFEVYLNQKIVEQAEGKNNNPYENKKSYGYNKNLRFHNFKGRDYDYDELEKRLLDQLIIVK